MSTPRCPQCGQTVATIITVADAAVRLGISKQLAYELIDAGRLPHVRLNGRNNGRLVIHWPAVEEWLHDESIESTHGARPSGRLRQVGA
ncbi:MAG: excisionase family DNA-binding protein [Chloroflexi bacterium]|nr:excisionase family DNA-binding protein [Chloroflexota bacterium]